MNEFCFPGETLIVGYHPVETLLRNGRLKRIWVRQGLNSNRISFLKTQALSNGIPFCTLDRRLFDQIVPSKSRINQGIIASAIASTPRPEGDLNVILSKNSRVHFLALDGITDSHNLGACIRSAEALGCSAVIQPKNRSASLNQIARKASCGATELIPLVEVTNLVRCLRRLKEKNFEVIGGDKDGQCINLLSPSIFNRVIVVGNEGSGLRRLTRDVCDKLVWISTIGNAKSLNVSVASGIMLFKLLDV